MSRVPAWLGVTCDHLIEDCPHRARSRAQLERHGLWGPVLGAVDVDGGDLCGWCVRVWKARNPTHDVDVDAPGSRLRAPESAQTGPAGDSGCTNPAQGR